MQCTLAARQYPRADHASSKVPEICEQLKQSWVWYLNQWPHGNTRAHMVDCASGALCSKLLLILRFGAAVLRDKLWEEQLYVPSAIQYEQEQFLVVTTGFTRKPYVQSDFEELPGSGLRLKG